jgi:hypothetical protein
LSIAHMWPSRSRRQWPPFRSALFATRSKAAIGQVLGLLDKREVMLVWDGVHAVLERPWPQRAVEPRRGGRDYAPAQEAVELVSGDLPLPETSLEIPQGPLPPGRFVDGEDPLGSGPQRHQESCVRAPRDPALDLDLVMGEGFEQRLGPGGNSGRPVGRSAVGRSAVGRLPTAHSAGGPWPFVFGQEWSSPSG